MGLARNGTGLAGSDTYSSNADSPAFGDDRLSLRPLDKYSGVAFSMHPLAQPAGQAGSRLHLFVPVSNAVAGATSAFGAPSFKYCARNGRRISSRKYRLVSNPNFSRPRELPSPICCP